MPFLMLKKRSKRKEVTEKKKSYNHWRKLWTDKTKKKKKRDYQDARKRKLPATVLSEKENKKKIKENHE